MPLILEMSEGHDVYIDGIKCVVDEIVDKKSCVVLVYTLNGRREYKLTDEYSVEVLPNVKASLGTNTNHRESVKIMFDAPRRLPIIRGNLYRRGVREKVNGF